MNEYKVIVPCKPIKNKNRWIRAVSYPASGCNLYTREQAIDVLIRFHERHPWQDGHEMEPYAEGTHERFTVRFPNDLTGRAQS